MKKSVVVAVIVLVLAIIILLVGSFWVPQGNLTASVASSEVGNYRCSDSDGEMEFGESLKVKGTTTRIKISTGKVLLESEDVCSSNRQVKEYYCTSTARINSVKKSCDDVCEDGVCVVKE
tara:strand:- start:1688 stop:2047 length:360 start_codon:yes stop_codon:yes gene_type:complete